MTRSPNTLLGDWGGARADLAQHGVGFGVQNQTELWGNMAGGRKQGITYDGLLTADLCIDLDKAAQWKGATVYASGYQIYGPGPTGVLVGALQFISNIEAVPSTKLAGLCSNRAATGSTAKSWFASGSKGQTTSSC